MSECPTPTGQTPTAPTSMMSRLLMAPFRFLASLINDDDHAVEMQLVGFAILLPFSVYWLQTRPDFKTGWTACFATVWGAVALKDIFKRRPQ